MGLPASTVPLKLYVFSVSANALQIQALIKDANIPLEVVTLNAQAHGAAGLGQCCSWLLVVPVAVSIAC